MAREPIIGALYRHNVTGRVYRVIAIGVIEATLVRAVVYQNLDPGGPWIRPVSEWFELVDGKPRFHATEGKPS